MVLKLIIKNMVSLRCKIVVKEELASLGVSPASIELGVVEIKEKISREVLEKLRRNLTRCGLELIDDKNSVLVEKTKAAIIEMVNYSIENPRVNYSDYISKKVNCDYASISHLFSREKGMTIQHFIIVSKIEKVKEFLAHSELNLTEISFKLGYSSVSHLSNQFKKITGYSPSDHWPQDYLQLKKQTSKDTFSLTQKEN